MQQVHPMHLRQLEFMFDMSCLQHQEAQKSVQTCISQLPQMPLLVASGAEGHVQAWPQRRPASHSCLKCPLWPLQVQRDMDKLGLRILNANIAEMQDLDDANRYFFSLKQKVSYMLPAQQEGLVELLYSQVTSVQLYK